MKKKLFALLLISCFSVSLLSASPVFADKYGLDKTAEKSGLQRYGKDVPTIVGSVIGAALSLISVVFFILMVYGGFLWMTAHGKEDQVKKAQDTIIAAVIGIIVVLASFAITSFVFNSVSNQQVSQGNNQLKRQNGEACQNDEQCAEGLVCLLDVCDVPIQVPE